MDVIFVTTAKTDEEARELLKQFNMPFTKEGGKLWLRSSNKMLAIASFILDDGTSTVSCLAVFALRILVSISAIGSLTSKHYGRQV